MMLFCAEITELKMLYNVLRAISIKDYAILRPMEEGLKVTLDEMKYTETSAYIPCSLFSFYHTTDNDKKLLIKISLKTLTEVLNIFGDDGNPNLKFSYKSTESPLQLVISHSEENITVDCEIRTMNLDDFDDQTLADECNLNKVVIKASILVELLQRLDNSADELKLSLSPISPYFSLQTASIAGDSEVSISKHSDSVSIYECEKPFEATYSFQRIRQILKVMHHADKVAISTGESGLLGFQLLINADDKTNNMYVEYYVTSQFLDED